MKREWTKKIWLKPFVLLCTTALGLTAFGATPLAVWNGDFNTATTRNGVTFDANGNTVNADGSVTIKEGATTGIAFTLPQSYSYIQAVFTVSNVTGTATANGVLVSTKGGGSARGGVYVKSGGLSTGAINGTTAWGTTTYDGELTSYTDNANQIRTFAVTQVKNANIANGLHLYEIYGGGTDAKIVYGGDSNNGLNYNVDYNVVTIGGFATTPTEDGAIGTMEGLTVLSVALYGSNSTWPLDSTARANFAMPAVYNVGSSTAISTINTTLESAGNTFVNITADNVYLTADATPAANVILPYDTTVTLTDGALSLSGSLPVKLPSSGVTSIAGSGVVVADDATALATVQGFATSFAADTWTGTVWLKNQEIKNLAPTTYGNSGSTLRLSGIYGYFGKAAYTAASSPALELEDDSYGYGLRFTDGYSYDSNSGWAYTQFPALKGSGKLITNTHTTNKGQLGLIMFQDWSEFTGSMALTNRTVWLGTSAAPASDNSALSVGTIYVESGKTFTAPSNFSSWYMTTGFTGAGTVKTTVANSQYTKAENAKWSGTVEVAADALASTASTPVYLKTMGSAAPSTIVLKGLSGSTHWLHSGNASDGYSGGGNHTISAIVQLDGDVTFNNGSSGRTYTFNKLTGSGAFSWLHGENIIINDVSGYTGTLASSSNKITVGVPTTPEVGALIAKVDSTNNKVSTEFNIGAAGKGLGELKTEEEVYGLYATSKATIGETGYTTLAQAIESASEGDTITLSSGATENALTIDKNLTIDFAENTTSIPYISIAEGKTLTLKRANKSNKIGYFTGGGNLVVSGNNTFRWEGMTGTTTLASITQDSSSGGISISGHGTINVSGDVNVAATLTFTPDSAEPAYITDGFTIKMTANSVNAGTLNGAATIETVDGTTVGAGTFYGPISGGVVASGNFTSQGAGLNGAIAVADGKTFTIGNRLASMSNIRFHLDATDSTTYTLEAETSNLSEIKGGDNTYSLESGSTAAVLNSGDENHFGGQPYFQFDGSKYARGNKVSAKSYIAVTHPDSLGGYLARYSDQDRLGTDSSVWFARCFGNSRNDYIVQNGTTDRTATAGADTIISLPTRITASDNREDHLGTSYVGAIAEFVGFTGAISVEDRVACEMYLMDKWNLAAAANFRPFASTAEVELGTGATLDLGGYTQTVASFTGGGTVQNGTLIVAGENPTYTNTGALTIPAVENMTIVLDEGATALTITGDAAGIKVVASEAFAANPSDVTITATGLTGENTIDFSGVPSLFRYGVTDNEDGTWTIAKATTFEAATYTWSPVGASTDWSSCANWKVDEQAVAVLPQSVDTVVFPAEGAPEGGWSVVLDAQKVVAAVQAAGDVTLTGARIQVCDPDTETAAVSGAGTVTLGDDAGFYAGSDADLKLTLAANMKINASSEHVAQIKGRTSGQGSGGATLKINGNLTGTGYLEVGGSRASINFNGDNSEFAGSVKVLDDSSSLGGAHRTSVQFTPSASSANAAWNIVYNNNSTFLGEVKKTYYFGELIGEINNSSASSRAASTVELGARNTDFELIYKSIAHDGRQDTIVKRGTGTMTMLEGTSAIGTYNIAAGTLYVASRGGAPINALTFTGGKLRVRSYDIEENEEVTTYKADWSALIKNSTAPIAFDDDGVDYTWATALDASNTALTKYGTGTLTLAEAPLAENFTITVAENGGSVVVPTSSYTLGEGTIVQSTADGKDTLVHGTGVAKVNDKPYASLAAAVANAQSGDTVTLLANTTLDARVEPNLGADTTLTIDLGGSTITRTGTSGNGSAFDVKSGTVTIKNGTINCTQDDTAIAKDGVYAITARPGSEVVLETLTVTVNSECGACVYPFANNDGTTITTSTVTIKSGTYSNTTTTPYRYKTEWTGMAVNQANKKANGTGVNTGTVATQMIFIEGGTFSQVNPALGDDSWADGEGTFLAAGYASTETSTGVWTVSKAGIPADGTGTEITPAEDTQEAADAVAAEIDVTRTDTAITADVSQETWNGYFTRYAEKVDETWVAKATLNPTVVLPQDGEQAEETEMLNDLVEVAKGSTTVTSVTVKGSKAGLCYWISGSTDVGFGTSANGTSQAGGGDLELDKPSLTGENGKAFFKVCVGVAAPQE